MHFVFYLWENSQIRLNVRFKCDVKSGLRIIIASVRLRLCHILTMWMNSKNKPEWPYYVRCACQSPPEMKWCWYSEILFFAQPPPSWPPPPPTHTHTQTKHTLSAAISVDLFCGRSTFFRLQMSKICDATNTYLHVKSKMVATRMRPLLASNRMRSDGREKE